MKTDNMLALINERSIAENMVESVRNISIIKPNDLTFLKENQKHLSTVCEKTFIWRTRQQKLSILHDNYHPTLHGKFHQSILEQKVFFEQAVELAKQAEELKLKLEALLLDKEELELKLEAGNSGSLANRRLDIQLREKQLEIGAKGYQLQQCTVAMDYRMREIKDWKSLQDELIVGMKEQGYTDEMIWDKEAGEAEDHFFLFLGNFQAVHQSKDSGEIQNLTALARHGVDQAIGLGKFKEWLPRCNDRQVKSLIELGYLRAKDAGEGKTLLTDANAKPQGLYAEGEPAK